VSGNHHSHICRKLQVLVQENIGFDNFIPVTTSKYSKALLREKEDKEVEVLNDRRNVEEEEEDFEEDIYEEEEYTNKEDLSEDGDGESL
jgi:hypothetical protein